MVWSDSQINHPSSIHMKPIYLLLTLFSLALPLSVEAKEEKKDAKKGAMKEEKKEILYTAVITPATGVATEGDLAELKNLLGQATGFKCKGVVLEGKEMIASLAIPQGRLGKSDVAKPLKDSRFKVGKVDDVKPEKEKKADPKKEEVKKDEAKPGDKPAEVKPDAKAEPKK
jgi:hypothetical protein